MLGSAMKALRGSIRGRTYPPEFVAAVDEWTYPGLKDAEGVPRPKVPKSYLGTWSGPVFSRKNCDGQCCQTVDVCDCPTCKQRTEGFGLPVSDLNVRWFFNVLHLFGWVWALLNIEHGG